ncbi:WSC domain-containing protein [Xylariaceae sp. FL0255]|nr:WSC domain-containing protein [Xylariaceae sp. FL0255]
MMITTRSTKATFGVAFALLANHADAFWRLPCSSPVVVERADPIVYPGAIAPHLHTVMGSNAFNFTMDYEDTQTATCSTCQAVEDLSNYWVPSLFYHAENGTFIPVPQSGGALIYYLQRSDPNDPLASEGLKAFPEGLRFLAGNPTLRNYTDTLEQQAVSFVCLGAPGGATSSLPTQNCPNGMRAQLTMPSCWDGVNLDSPDHKSHMAYPSMLDNGVCPSSHPHRFITIFYEVTWSVDTFKDEWYGSGQPFVFSTGDPTGYGYHGDFVNGWDVATLQKAINECTDDSGDIQDCAAFTLREDDDMASCKTLARVDEPTSGILATLPGCNPIQPGPAPAVQQAGCGAPTEIGDPILPFTDVTNTLGWRWVACAKDPAGQSRTLDGSTSLDQANMTVEYCINTCRDAGFSYAGVEYWTQCFCGNTLADDRLPTNGTIGDCSLPCAGNSTELCGGVARVGVYTQCDSASDCTNGGLPLSF